MFVGSFEGDFDEFQTDVVSAINQFKASGVSQVLIDLTNNGGKLEVIVVFQILHSDVPIIGGFVCLGHFLHQYLAGTFDADYLREITLTISPGSSIGNPFVLTCFSV